ncbi:MAG: hypothetical protein ACOY3P_16710 [Planctomycetota bacterium]
MPKKADKVNKAEEVRAYFRANPQAKNREVVQALAKRGIKISVNYPSIVRGYMKAKGQPKAAAGSASRAAGKVVPAPTDLKGALRHERDALERRLAAINTLLEG